MNPIFFFGLLLVGLQRASLSNFTLLGYMELVKKFVVVGGWVGV